MESFIGLILIIIVVAFIFFFKPMIKKVGKYSDDVVTTNISESQTELIERSMNAYEEVKTKFGDNYLTPQQVYDRMMRRQPKDTSKKK